MHDSIWSETVSFPGREVPTGDLDVDAAVIGGGLAGILTAHFLRSRGLHTVVLEAARVGGGQTGNTTAKITSQHGLIYRRLIDRFGKELAGQYAQSNQAAIAEYRRIIDGQKIACDFAECSAYLYTNAAPEQLTHEFGAASELGLPAVLTKETELPFSVASALRFDSQARFHPLKFLAALAAPLEIYENTPVLRVEDHRVVTEHCYVTAKHIIFACHYPFVNAPGYYFLRQHQERSYVLALKNAQNMAGTYLGIDPDGLSFRPQDELILLGGGGHRTGENSAGGRYDGLRKSANAYWPKALEVASWSAQDCMTLDGVPYIGRFSASTPDWYVATGFQKWGMTTSMVSAMVLSDLIVKGESPWAEVFAPQRFQPSASAKSFLREAGQAAKGLTRRLLTPPRAEVEALPRGHGGVVEVDGEKCGVYKDKNGEIYCVSIKCPHLGCQLEWNPDEKSWDCPCHGSRFDFRGNLLDNPAQIGLETEKES